MDRRAQRESFDRARTPTGDLARPLVLVGCGYLGLTVLAQAASRGTPLRVLTRSPDKAARLRAIGCQACPVDWAAPRLAAPPPPSGSAVVVMMGGRRRAGGEAVVFRRDVWDRLCRWLSPDIGRLIYVSTTGVYGPRAGRFDEASTPHPARPSAEAHYAVEQEILASRFARRATIIRLGGLYGAGRLPLAGRSPDHAGGATMLRSGWLNLIQVEDAARIVRAQAAAPEGPFLLVATDGRPVSRRAWERAVQAPVRENAARPIVAADSMTRIATDVQPDRIIRSRYFDALIRPHLAFPDALAALQSLRR